MSEALGLTELTDAKAPLLSEIFRLSKVSVLKSESPTPSEVIVVMSSLLLFILYFVTIPGF